MDYAPNQSGLDQVFAELGARVEAIDADLRARYAGRPIDEIIGPATQAWQSIGIHSFSPAWIQEYATAVSSGQQFKLEVD